MIAALRSSVVGALLSLAFTGTPLTADGFVTLIDSPEQSTLIRPPLFYLNHKPYPENAAGCRWHQRDTSTPTSLSPLKFGAVGDGVTDNTSALQATLGAAKAQGLPVVIPAGIFNHSGNIIIDSIAVSGVGDSSVLAATNPATSAIILKGNKPSLSRVTTTVHPTARLGTMQDSAISIDHATGFHVSNCTVIGSASTGIMSYGSTNGIIQNNSVVETYADGIGIINAFQNGTNNDGALSSNIQIIGNRVERAGDDSYDVVTYGTSGDVCNFITIRDNTAIQQRSGRSIAIVGARNVMVSGNYLDSSTSDNAGITLMADNGFGTFGVWDTAINGNMIKGLNSAGGIQVWNGYGSGATFPRQIYGNTISSNRIVSPTRDAIVLTGAAGVHDITVSNNISYGAGNGRDPFKVTDTAPNIVLNGNRALAFDAYSGDLIAQNVGSGASLPPAVQHSLQISASGDSYGGQPPILGVTIDGLAAASQIQITTAHGSGWQTITLHPYLSKATFVTFQLMNDPAAPTVGFPSGPGNRAIYIRSVSLDGVEMVSSALDVTGAAIHHLNIPNPITRPP